MNQKKNRMLGLTKSHPKIQFQQIPIVEGPLSRIEQLRHSLMDEVIQKTVENFSQSHLEMLLGEVLYLERLRMNRKQKHILNWLRFRKDQELLSCIHRQLFKSNTLGQDQVLLKRVIKHYTNEISGHFDPKIYHFATHVVPWGFSWLLNAASVRRFFPFGMTESLRSRLHILGEVPMVQKLAEKGTILLVPTHQSNIDSVLIGYVIYLMSLPPFSYGAGLNLFENPLLSFFMSRLGAYRIDRSKKNILYKNTLKNYSVCILKEGVHSIFFPGGGRSRSGAIETKVKLGLLGTGLEAQLEGMKRGNPKSKVYIIPMVMSYHFVLEASALIESHLAEVGKHRFILMDDDSWQPLKMIRFFWKLFSSQSGITVRIGKPLDIFGNFVDENGESRGPNGTIIDPTRWLMTGGELRKEPQRDQEYTRRLGGRLTEQFHKGNTVLTSHVVAFVFFETLRKKYPEFDLFRFLRLSLVQRTMVYADFLIAVEYYHRLLVQRAQRGDFILSTELQVLPLKEWVRDGIQQLGLFHHVAVLKVYKGMIKTEDMNLLYYYRNRLSGYGLSVLVENSRRTDLVALYDEQGFLA